MCAIGSEHIDSMVFGRYISKATAKSVVGGRSPKVTEAHNRAQSGFFVRDALSHLSMVDWVGEPKGSPGSSVTGTANPAQFTTSQSFAALGGESLKLTEEAAIMATIPAEVAPAIQVVRGQAVTSSIDVSEYFHKRHDDVLKRIRNLDCSTEFTARNFAASEYTDTSGRKLPCYLITRDGFAFLAMGFTGKRAAAFKEAYISAFNEMEQTLKSPLVSYNLSSAKYNLNTALWNLDAVDKAWEQSLRPMLVAANSPLAGDLHDHIKDTLICLHLIQQSMGGDK